MTVKKYLVFSLFFFTFLLQSVQSGNSAIRTITKLCDLYNPNGYYDEDLGHVKLDLSIYCTAMTLRAIPGYTCCTPEPPTPASEMLNVSSSSSSPLSNSSQFPVFYFFEPQNQSQAHTVYPLTQLNWRQEEPAKSLLSQYERVVYLIHGYSENFHTSVWLNRTIKAWVSSRQTPVVVVDWSAKNKNFFQTVANIVTVGKTIGFSIIKWNILDKSYLVGHSAGSQVVSEVGNYIKEQGLLLKHCVVLDPAGPGFDTGDEKMRISKDDCEVVEAIHSSSPQVPILGPVVLNKYGTFHKVGDCDYYINCGNTQGNDCEDPKPYEKRSKRLTKDQSISQIIISPESREDEDDQHFCSHHRAPLVFASQVTKNCTFQSQICQDCSSMRFTNSCRFEKEIVGTIPPDTQCKPSDNLSFYVAVLSKYPYC